MRNESIVGQIIACPKCGSMVEVHPPAEPATVPSEADSPIPETPLMVEAGKATLLSPLVAISGGLLILGLLAIGAVAFWPAAAEVPPEDVASAERDVPKMPTEPIATEPSLQAPEPEPIAKRQAAVDLSLSAVEEPTEIEPTPPPQPDSSLSAKPKPEPTVEEPQVEEVPKLARREPTKPETTRQFDALDFDPESLDLETLSEAQPTVEEAKLEMPVRTQTSNVVEPQPTTVPAVRRGSVPEKSAKGRDAREQFARKLPAIEIREMPLVEFLQLISQLSGTPVSVDAEQLLMAGISARRRVSLDATDVTLDAALSEVLASLKLEHAYQGPHVIVSREGAEQSREIDYPLDDLIDSADEGEALIGLIQKLVAPDSWQSGSAKLEGKSLAVTQSQQIHYELLVFLERLRIVGSQVTRSRFPVERLAPTPLHAAMAARLSGPAQFTFTSETPLAEVVQHWQRELDVPLLVDWVALAELDLWPEATIACAIADRNWQQALTEVLEPLGLDWRVSFGGTIEISTAEQLARDYQLELYPLQGASASKGQQVVEALAKHLRAVTGSDESALLFHPQSGAILARQPAYAQRAILEWLGEK